VVGSKKLNLIYFHATLDTAYIYTNHVLYSYEFFDISICTLHLLGKVDMDSLDIGIARWTESILERIKPEIILPLQCIFSEIATKATGFVTSVWHLIVQYIAAVHLKTTKREVK
jgi:hypothetical protein